MKTPTITPIPLAAQIAAAEKQASDFRHRRAQLQADLADLRDQQQLEMRRTLGSGGTSPELKALRVKIAEGEALLDQADGMIADADRLVIELHAQVAAARTAEETATHAVELTRRSSIVKTRIAELEAALEAADKIAGAFVLAVAELEQIDKVAAARLAGEARHLDPKAAFLAQGWKIGEFLFSDAFEWYVVPLLPPVAGLDRYPGVNIRGYLAARDAATQAAPGARQ